MKNDFPNKDFYLYSLKTQNKKRFSWGFFIKNLGRCYILERKKEK
jgi:hypothetical protein